MGNILFFFHCGSNTGYAIGRHERTFARMAHRLLGDYQRIHFAYPSLARGRSPGLPEGVQNILEFNPASSNKAELSRIADYVRKHEVRVAFGFDQPVRQPAYPHMRKAGVRRIISYWGAPMSSLNAGLKLLLKRIDVALARGKPDHFVFQSEGMRSLAVNGRGIPGEMTSVVHSGVDIELFRPPKFPDSYAHDAFGIPRSRKIIFFSGHMEERKGVHVIVKTAAHLVNERGRSDVHFLLLGNVEGQERRFDPLFRGTEAEGYITFGGYRPDVPEIHKSCYAGMIGTTGWDSHTLSAVEMASSGMPLIVSDIIGLREAVSRDTGFLFPIGDHETAAERIEMLLDDEALRREMGSAARLRVEQGYTLDHQIDGLEKVVRHVAGDFLTG